MKKGIFIVFCIVAIALSLTSCKKHTQVTRLSSVVTENIYANNVRTRIVQDFTWYRGELMTIRDTIDSSDLLAPFTYCENLIYEGHNLKASFEHSGKWQTFFTYDGDRLESFLNINEGDTVYYGSVLAYNAEGLIEEYTFNYKEGLHIKYHVTWENGDAVKVVKYILAPAENVDTITTHYSYDDKPSCYTGYPLALSIENENRLTLLQSKHNRIEDGYIYQYDGDRIVSKTHKDGSSTTRFSYIVQTLD